MTTTTEHLNDVDSDSETTGHGCFGPGPPPMLDDAAVEAVRGDVRAALRDQGLDTVPADERSLACARVLLRGRGA